MFYFCWVFWRVMNERCDLKILITKKKSKKKKKNKGEGQKKKSVVLLLLFLEQSSIICVRILWVCMTKKKKKVGKRFIYFKVFIFFGICWNTKMMKKKYLSEKNRKKMKNLKVDFERNGKMTRKFHEFLKL